MKRFEQFLEKGQPKLVYAEYSQHPSQEVLTAYVYEQLDGSVLSRVSAHVTTCQVCYEKVLQLRSELNVLESQLAFLLPDPLKRPVEEKKEVGGWVLSPAQWVKTLIRAILEGWSAATPSQRRVVRHHLLAYATTGALLFVVNNVLDRLFIPPASPVASPEFVPRWWVHSYWILLPWGLLLLGWGIRVFLLKRQKNKE